MPSCPPCTMFWVSHSVWPFTTLSVLVIFCAASLVHPQVNRDSHSQGGPEFVRLVHTRDTLSLHTCLKEWTIQNNKPWIKSMRRCTLIPFYLQREIEWFFFFLEGAHSSCCRCFTQMQCCHTGIEFKYKNHITERKGRRQISHPGAVGGDFVLDQI